jgi:hypothetical protein
MTLHTDRIESQQPEALNSDREQNAVLRGATDAIVITPLIHFESTYEPSIAKSATQQR